MELEMHLEGQDATPELVEGVEDWLKNAQIGGLVVEHKGGRGTPEGMGIDMATMIVTPLVEPLMDGVKSVFQYMEMRRPNVAVKMKVGGVELEIDAKNLKDQDAFLRRILSLAKAQGT